MTTDYTACNNHNCPIKNSCFRYMGPRSEYQSVFVDDPCEWYEDWFYCDYFLQDRHQKVMKIVESDFKKYEQVFKNLA